MRTSVLFLAAALLVAMATAASAGGGWYLLNPPPESIHDKQTPPLSQWAQIAAFDTVDKCEAAPYPVG
jgi:hypothetical protein